MVIIINSFFISPSQVSEVTNTPSGDTTATALVTITITDVNDQTPTFSAPAYQAAVFENTQVHIPITLLPEGTEMTVYDYDGVCI